VPTADNVEFYAAAVAEDALTRRVRIACSQIAHSALEGEELLQHALQIVTRLGGKRTDGAVTMSELAPKVLEQMVEQIARRGEGDPTVGGFATGLDALDAYLGGIQPGVVTVLGGRPSMGKSALARTIAQNASAAGFGVHVFSLEDVRGAYARRALADIGRVDLHRVNTLQLAGGDIGRLDYAAQQLAQHTRWLVDDVAGVSASQIGMKVRQHIVENRTRLVVVDYVQIMREPDARRGDKRVQVALSVEGLHELARRENVAVLLVSQLNRKLEERDDKRPQMSDLREAGELEQIADAILFCYRDDVYNPDGPKGRAEVIVAKNKHGRPGTAMLVWDASTATYRNPSARTMWGAAPERERQPGEDDEP
jgi:replicative DNA helicase